MRVLFLDIDGYVVKADIQKYVSKIELFSDDAIKDYEYIKNCLKFMLEEASKKDNNEEEIEFINKVYNFVSKNLFEMLKEYRDCFLEYDNLESFEDKINYNIDYQKNPVSSSNDSEVPKYMEYIIGTLKYTKLIIEKEIERVKLEGGSIHLPFNIINVDNDIISYEENESPLRRATSALNRMELTAINREQGRDDFLTATGMIGNSEIVNYDEIYTKENIIPGVVEGLRYLRNTGKVDMIIACSHYTGYREGEAKNKLFHEEMPFVLMFKESLLKFHTEPARMGMRRERSSKNMQIEIMKKRISDIFGIDPDSIETILGDDSLPNLVGLENKVGILYRPLTKQEIEFGDNQVDDRFIRQYSWDRDELDRVFGLVDSKLKKDDKKLIK